MKIRGAVVVFFFALLLYSPVLLAQAGAAPGGYDYSGTDGLTAHWDLSAVSPVSQVLNIVDGGPALQFGPGSSAPSYLTDQNNGNSAIAFDGSDDYATIPGNILGLISTDGGTMWMVYQLDDIGTNADPINENEALINGGHAGIFLSTDAGIASVHGYNYCGVQHVFSSSTMSNPTQPHMVMWDHLGGYNMYICLDGVSTTPVAAWPTLSTGIPSPVEVGRNSTPTTPVYIDGRIYEILITEVALNTMQGDLLMNYFSARHNITMPGSYDYYHGDETGNGDYDRRVTAIGQGYNGNVLVGRSDGLILEDQGFAQDDGDHIYAGHKAATNSVTSVTTGGGNAHYRWGRVWYMNVNDAAGTTGGNIDISFDFSEGGVGGTPSGTYYLLMSTDAGSSWSEHSSTTSISGDQVTFADVDVTSLSDGSLVTLGAQTAAVLPVELSLFAAMPEQALVRLEWRTATEVNNYGFEVERANGDPYGNGGAWANVGFVQGNGTKSSPTMYSFRDSPPGPGTYCYRLKQIDLDGTAHFSEMVNVRLGPVPSGYSLDQNYPNPCNPVTTVRFGLPEAGRVRVVVYSILGEEIATLVNGELGAGYHTVRFNASNLTSGLYLLRLEAAAFSATKKILVTK